MTTSDARKRAAEAPSADAGVQTTQGERLPMTTEQACRIIARASWPGEFWQNREAWQPQIATDPALGRRELARARAKTQEVLDLIDLAALVLGLETL